jgi:hypothetical protein
MIEILIEFTVKLLGWAFPFTLRWKYPPKRIDELIKIRISPQGNGIEFWSGDMPKVRAYIEITNLSPFPLEIERAYGTFEYGSDLEKFIYLKRESIRPASEISIPIEASITKEHVAVIRRLMPSNPRPALRFNAHVLCKVHNFELSRAMETSHHRLVNFNVID